MITEKNWCAYEYTITKLIVKLPTGTNFEASAMHVQNLYIEKDYDNDIMPILMMQMAMPQHIYKAIAADPYNTTFVMTVVKEINKDGKRESRSVFIDGEFSVSMEDITPHVDENLYEKTRESAMSGDGGGTIGDMHNFYTFILQKKDNLKSSKTVINKVLCSANMLNAVATALTLGGAKKVLMSQPDNKTSYTELILLPLQLIQELKYMNSMYGLYKQGLLVFYDFDILYILRKCANTNTFQNNEVKEVTFIIDDASSNNVLLNGSCVENNLGYVSVSQDGFVLRSGVQTVAQYTGQNTLLIHKDGTSTNISTNANSPTAVVTTTSHNKYIDSETKLRMSEMECQATIEVMNIDLGMITPNKRYRITSTSSKVASLINTQFRISLVRTIFIREGDYFRAATEIVLKKSEG